MFFSPDGEFTPLILFVPAGAANMLIKMQVVIIFFMHTKCKMTKHCEKEQTFTDTFCIVDHCRDQYNVKSHKKAVF